MARFADAGESVGFHSDAVGELARGFGGARTTENISLDHADAKIPDQLEVVVRLDAFGAGIHPERFGERDDGSDDRRVAISGGCGSANEALVDLALVERRFLQLDERTIAGPDIV